MLLFESTYFIFFVVISIYYSYISAHCHLTKKEVTTDITQHMVNRTSQHINSTSTDNRNTTLVVETYASKKLLPNGLIYIILLLSLVLTICFRVFSRCVCPRREGAVHVWTWMNIASMLIYCYFHFIRSLTRISKEHMKLNPFRKKDNVYHPTLQGMASMNNLYSLVLLSLGLKNRKIKKMVN